MTRRLGIAAAAAALAASTVATAAWGDSATTVQVFPAGLACADFDLQVEASGGTIKQHDITDRSGEVVRVILAGTGPALTLTNLTSGATYSTPSNGSVTHIAVNPDGTLTYRVTGHNILILFPTDVPPGPSTTLYVGQVGFTVDANAVFTVTSMAGRSVDICTALS
ncbi:MAG TPA: hypothetical protein VEQ83_12530 [Lapillicoccus sp.]|nr:hypothetical protein [Lapillicoccus sp.]